MAAHTVHRPPASPLNEAMSATAAPESGWSSLYKIGALSALILVLLTVIQITVFMSNPPPSTVAGWFALYQTNRLVALIDHDLLLVVDWALFIPIYLALYVALRPTNPGLALLSVALALVAVAVYLSSNTSIHMLLLSDQYAAASTETQRSAYVAAGQAMLAIYQGTAFQASYVLGSIAPIVISMVMLQSQVFSKATGYAGIAANVLAFGLYVPGIGIFLAILSAVALMIWDILIARRLWRMASDPVVA